MKEFTIKNLVKYWCKIWPLTLILIVAGVGAGFMLVKTTKQSYEANIDVLVINSDRNAVANDYASLFTSDLVEGVVTENSDYADCSTDTKTTGNVVNITTSCGGSGSQALKFNELLVEQFSAVASQLYEDNLDEVTILSSDKEAKPTVTTSTKLMKIAVPVIAAIATSMVVAFIGLDIKVSKAEKKK